MMACVSPWRMIKSTPLRISSPVSETLAFNPETSRITSPFCALVVVIATLLPTPRLSRREEEDKEDKEEEEEENDDEDIIIIIEAAAVALQKVLDEIVFSCHRRVDSFDVLGCAELRATTRTKTKSDDNDEGGE
jgi:hypothetical protein